MGVVQKELVQSGLVQITPQYFQMMLVHMGVVQIMKNFIGSEVKTTCSCCRNVKKMKNICKLISISFRPPAVS